MVTAKVQPRASVDPRMSAKVSDSGMTPDSKTEDAALSPATLVLRGIPEETRYSVLLEKSRVVARRIYGDQYFTGFMTGVTLYILFAGDLMVAVCDSSFELGFVITWLICFVLFAVEMILQTLTSPTYLCGFYFWIDFVSTVSIIFDIPFIIGEGDSSGNVKDAGHSARLGTRASRVIRIIRLVRMVRVIKLYKMHNGGNETGGAAETLEPSKVGKKLTEMTTRRLILMMLSMIIVLPWLMQSSLVLDKWHEFEDNFLKHLHMYPQNFNSSAPHISEATFKAQVQFYARKSNYPLLYLEVCQPQTLKEESLNWYQCNTTWHYDELRSWVKDCDSETDKFRQISGPSNHETKNGVFGAVMRAENRRHAAFLRRDEYFMVQHVGCYGEDVTDQYGGGIEMPGPTGGAKPFGLTSREFRRRRSQGTCVSVALFSTRAKMQFLAVMAILKTLFIMCMLIGSSLAFNKDAQIFVIGPIERMMTLVKKLSDNPLDAAIGASSYTEEEEEARKEGYETALLEQTLERIGQLLQVGFGAAGAEIIGKNMNTGSGKLNPMIPGKKITAIYGFCDIRQFTDTTECLQEEVMVYVNKLGSLTHTLTHSYYGMANKNVGDAFLLSWKVCDGKLEGFTTFDDLATEEQRLSANEHIRCLATNGALRIKKQITPSQMADAAVTAFVKCQIDLELANSEGNLKCYATYASVIKRFGPGFKIQMGFGMHVGWAVEGAIGSELKIDATYLSPHVEMSDRLEASSKIFLAKLNISHWLVNLCSPGLKDLMRVIAHIRVEGVPIPFKVWTYDVTDPLRSFGLTTVGINPASGKQDLPDWKHPDYTEIQKSLHPDFLATFRGALAQFADGDWPEAKDTFEHCLKLKPQDGPTLYTTGFMRSCNDKCPDDWDGTHYLLGF